MHSRWLYVRYDIYFPIKDINGSRSTGKFQRPLTEQDAVANFEGPMPLSLVQPRGALTPPTLQWGDDLRVNDDRRK